MFESSSPLPLPCLSSLRAPHLYLHFLTDAAHGVSSSATTSFSRPSSRKWLSGCLVAGDDSPAASSPALAASVSLGQRWRITLAF